MAEIEIAVLHQGLPRLLGRLRRSLCFSLTAALALALLRTTSLVAQSAHPTESQVEAAYLFNFGKFVTWPGSRPASPDHFDICVFGKDPFGEVLDATVSGESISGKAIKVLRLARLQEASACNILFISTSEESHLPAILQVAQNLSVLTVSDIGHFAERGGIIGLVPQQGRIRFEVNMKAAEHCHLQLSSELLKVAVKVIEKNPPQP